MGGSAVGAKSLHGFPMRRRAIVRCSPSQKSRTARVSKTNQRDCSCLSAMLHSDQQLGKAANQIHLLSQTDHIRRVQATFRVHPNLFTLVDYVNLEMSFRPLMSVDQFLDRYKCIMRIGVPTSMLCPAFSHAVLLSRFRREPNVVAPSPGLCVGKDCRSGHGGGCRRSTR